MFRYYVVSKRLNCDDEWVQYKTNDLSEAISEARYFASGNDNHYYVELRSYYHDIEDDDCICFDYDLIDFN